MTFLCWALRRWVFEAYCREYPTRNLELGIPDVGHSRRWVFQMLGIPYENPSLGIPSLGIPVKHGRNTHYILYVI